MENSSMEKLKTGTTTVAVVCKDGVVLASDRRATMGYLIASKDVDKIFAIDEHLAMTIAGGVGDAQMLIRWMQAEAKLYRLRHGRPITVESAATLLANILAQYKYFPFFVQLLLGGYDERPRVFSIDMLGGVTEEKYTSTGSGSPVAYGVLEELYSEEQVIAESVRVAAKAVSAAIQRDAGTGERVDLVIVDKRGFRRYGKDEVKQVLAKA
ncbi:MAG TPA: archaeal proteasome endopeptidase complex subunit beta [Candidatus Bilamarchaeaceae archaeon]|nr:archaeal proteasome endopeptidase complex subunit beta [Candidatus Bilamarchaeaceae archaeon]